MAEPATTFTVTLTSRVGGYFQRWLEVPERPIRTSDGVGDGVVGITFRSREGRQVVVYPGDNSLVIEETPSTPEGGPPGQMELHG
jgi:hypothetical protein